jgi:hypothetical protein
MKKINWNLINWHFMQPRNLRSNVPLIRDSKWSYMMLFRGFQIEFESVIKNGT